MKWHNVFFVALSSALLLSTTIQANEAVSIDYKFGNNTGVNLASVSGRLSISHFSDSRIDIAAEAIGMDGQAPVMLADSSASELMQSAFEQAFVASGVTLGVTLTEGEASFSLAGNLIEMKLTQSEVGLRVLIRCELTLRQGSRNAWQNVVFSQIQSDNTDIKVAISRGLDRLISELFADSYFLMELGIL